MADITLRVYASDLTTFLGELDQPYGIAWSHERMDLGAGQFSIPHDSPAVQSVTGLLAPDNLVVVTVDADPTFAWSIRRRSRARGDVWDPIAVTGPGAADLLRSALVYPRAGLETPIVKDQRVFGWQHVDFDDTDWTQVAGSRIGPRIVTPGWPDDDAVGFAAFQAETRSLYRRLLLATPGDEGPARMILAATYRTEVVVWLDGDEVLRKEPGTIGLHYVDLEYIAFDHQLAVEVIGGPGVNSGRWGWTWIRLAGDPEAGGEVAYGSVIRRTFDPAEFPGADTDWLVYEDAQTPETYPGVTPGFVLTRLFDEAQARGGTVSVITRDFDDELDSDGVPWSQELELTVQVGNDSVLTAAERMRDVGVDIDVEADLDGDDLDLTFRAWTDRGVDRGETPDGGETTVTLPLDGVYELDTETEDETFNVLLVRTEQVWLEEPSPAPSSGRREGFLALGLTPSDFGGRIIARRVLDEMNAPRQLVRFGMAGSLGGPEPVVDFDVADTVRGPWLDPDDIAGAWTLADGVVETVAARLSDTGDVEWILEVTPQAAG